MVQPPGGVVVARAELQAAMLYGMFRQRAISLRISRLNSRVGRRRLLGLDLPQLPAVRQHRGHPLLELDDVHRLDGLRLAVGRGVGVQHGREVGRRLRRGEHRQRVAPQLGEQRQRRRDLGDAAMLARADRRGTSGSSPRPATRSYCRRPGAAGRRDAAAGRGSAAGCRRRRGRCRRCR